jgi:hypothetical protein
MISLENGAYNKDRVLEDLNDVIKPILASEFTYPLLKRHCPSGDVLTQPQVEEMVNGLSFVINTMGMEKLAKDLLEKSDEE